MASMAVLLPSLALVLTQGSFQGYRAAQAAFVGLLVLAVLGRRTMLPPSWQAATLAATCVFSSALALNGPLDQQASSLLAAKAFMLAATLLLADQLRDQTFRHFAMAGAPVASFIVIIVTAELALTPWQGKRPDFFGHHPNWGGEILFGCVVLISFAPRSWLRWMTYAAALAALIALQSRAAMLGSLIIIAGVEGLRALNAFGWRRAAIMALLAATMLALSLAAASLALPHHVAQAWDLIGSDVLLLDHPERGFGTGLVGRTDGWRVAWDAFASAPLTGHGLDQTIMPNGQAIHNGYLATLAAFGMAAAGPFAVLVAALVGTLRKDKQRFVVLTACCFVFFFNARSLNLNIFPLLLWLACLPWQHDEWRHDEWRRDEARN